MRERTDGDDQEADAAGRCELSRYRIDPVRSSVTIDASSSVHPIHSRTDGLEGWLDLDDAKGRLELPVDRLRSGNPLEERELKRRIDARRFPRITGEIEEVVALGEGRHRVTGKVTFRGVSRSHTDEVTIEPEGDALRIRGSSQFDVRDYGMEPPRILVLRVHPDVVVTIDVIALPEV